MSHTQESLSQFRYYKCSCETIVNKSPITETRMLFIINKTYHPGPLSLTSFSSESDSFCGGEFISSISTSFMELDCINDVASSRE